MGTYLNQGLKACLDGFVVGVEMPDEAVEPSILGEVKQRVPQALLAERVSSALYLVARETTHNSFSIFDTS